MSEEKAHQTALACPVCGKHMDVITHPTETLGGMAAAMLGNDGRWVHRNESPQCAEQPGWMQGWVEVPLGVSQCK